MRKMAQTVRWPGASNAPSSSICACRQVRCCTNMHANGRTAEAKRVGRCSMAVSLGRDPSLYAPPASPPNQTHATTYPKWPKSSLYHVWTARRVQVGLRDPGLGMNAVMCPAFDAGPLSAGPDGIRERHPNNRAACYGHWYKRIMSLVGSTDSHLLRALKPSAAARFRRRAADADTLPRAPSWPR